MNKIKISIIGSSGKGGLLENITNEIYENMIINTEVFISRIINFLSKKFSIPKKEIKDNIIIQSGGCALSDHLLIELVVNNFISNAIIFSPCEWDFDKHQYIDNGKKMWYDNAGKILNDYHNKFSKQLNKNSLEEIHNLLINKRIIFNTDYKGFHSRNTKVSDCDALIAFTTSEKGEPDDGGTLDTWNKCKGKRFHMNILH